MIEWYEKERLPFNLRTVNCLIFTLVQAGWLLPGHVLPLQALQSDIRGGRIKYIDRAVETAESRLSDGVRGLQEALSTGFDQSAISRAIALLVQGLVACWPWSASPVIMTAEQACTVGLSQV